MQRQGPGFGQVSNTFGASQEVSELMASSRMSCFASVIRNTYVIYNIRYSGRSTTTARTSGSQTEGKRSRYNHSWFLDPLTTYMLDLFFDPLEGCTCSRGRNIE